jgi:hypothetical protein
VRSDVALTAVSSRLLAISFRPPTVSHESTQEDTMTGKLTRVAIAAAILVALLVGGVAVAGNGSARQHGDCDDPLPRGSERVDLDPADFTTRIDNPYWPMAPGSRWVYRETDAEGNEQKVVVTVTNRTKTVAAGIQTRVVRDVVTEDGQPVEVSDDWYAQDECGHVWYLGEDTTEFESGRPVSKAGSWEAGVDGAQAGIIVPAEPRVGLQYRQEHHARRGRGRGRGPQHRRASGSPVRALHRRLADERLHAATAEGP